MGSVDSKNRGAVLVVDDNGDLREMLRDALESQGYVVVEADDGKRALDLLRLAGTPRVRVVILDLTMPNMSGPELIEILRRDPNLSHIPVLVMSGVSACDDKSGMGATISWLQKPFGEEELFAAVRAAFGRAPT